jgi:hypothetical protein
LSLAPTPSVAPSGEKKDHWEKNDSTEKEKRNEKRSNEKNVKRMNKRGKKRHMGIEGNRSEKKYNMSEMSDRHEVTESAESLIGE